MLATLAAIQFTTTLDFMVMMPLAPQFTRLFGLSAREFGYLISAYTFAAAAAGIVTSVFVDRFDRKRLLLAVYLGFVGSAVVTAAAQSYLDAARRARAGRNLRRRACGGSFSRSSATRCPSPPRPRHRHRDDVVLCGDGGGRSGRAAADQSVQLACCIRARCRARHRRRRGRAPSAADVRTSVSVRDSRGVWKEFVRTLTFPNHLRAFVFTLLMMISGFTVIPYVSLYITSNAGLPERDLPWIYLVGGVATFFTARWIGRWADRAGKREVYRRIALISLLPLLADHARAGAAAVRRAGTDHALLRLRVGSLGAGDGDRHQCRASGRARVPS